MKWVFRIGNWFFCLYLILQTLGRPKIFTRQVNGASFRLRRGTSDWHIVKEIWGWGSYGKSPSGIVVDIGANIGAYTVMAAKNADKVFAFEPDAGNREFLQENLKRNECHNARVFGMAVTGERGRQLLYSGGRHRAASSLYWKMTAGAGTEVETVTLADVFELCEIDRIDVLKIDAEGAEYDIPMKASPEVLDRIELIEVEYHPIPGLRRRQLKRFLREAGFEVRHFIHWYTPITYLGIFRAVKLSGRTKSREDLAK